MDFNLLAPNYHPKASKTYLIVKNEELLERAKTLFGSTAEDVNITVDGHRHIGAVIGSNDFKEEYVNEKIDRWIEDVHQLAEFAKEEPQSALSAFNIGLSQRWKFTRRTIPNISHLFEKLEDAIRQKLIPAICGRSVSEVLKEGYLQFHIDLEEWDFKIPAKCRIESTKHHNKSALH